MTPRRMSAVIAAIPVLLGAWQVKEKQKSQVSTQIETVSLCQLTSDWRKYDHLTVRINAIYRTGNETSEVYDLGCATRDHTAWVALQPFGSPSPMTPELKEKLEELLKQNGRARISVVGEFDGPKSVDIPQGISPEGEAVFRKGGGRYGHQNLWKFQFIFSKIESVEAVPVSDPWPRWATERNK
ncbi:MAG: hypothetical protein WCA00_08190 [Candidatus Acidiferrales bacterium]